MIYIRRQLDVESALKRGSILNAKKDEKTSTNVSLNFNAVKFLPTFEVIA